MESLRDTLKIIGPHLPPGFLAVNGLKSLFPSGYAGTISVLINYVYTERGNAQAGASDNTAGYFVGADGAGRWFMSWTPRPESLSVANYRLQGGFVFLYANDGQARGFVDTSRPDVGQMSCAQGTDAWIAANWPKLFASNVYFDFQDASGFDSLPPESNIWTNAGFEQNDFVALDGANCPSANTGTGSNIFSEIYMSMQVRDTSLLATAIAQNMTGAQFWDSWASSQASQTTINNLSKYLAVRYVSSDMRSVIVSGSVGAYGAVPSAKLSIAADTTVSLPETLIKAAAGAGLVDFGGYLVTGGAGAAFAGAATGDVPVVVVGGFELAAGTALITVGSALLEQVREDLLDSTPSSINPVSQLPDGSTLIGPLPPNVNATQLITLPVQPNDDDDDDDDDEPVSP